MGVYAPTTWTTTTGINIARLNNLEGQYADASVCLPPGLFTAYVQSGLVATKDGTTASQLDVTSGVAWLQQSDGTLQRIAPASSTQATATPSTTYYLYLQPDGTWYWSTSNSPAANSLEICTVTTDGSGNISAVTDARTLTTTLLSGMSTGRLTLPPTNVAGSIRQSSGLGMLTNTITLALAAGTNLNNSTAYVYAVTAVDALGGETAISAYTSSITTTTGNQAIALSNIPLGPTGTVARNIYRSYSGNTWGTWYVHQIADNTTTSWTDTTADGSYGALNKPYSTFMGGIQLNTNLAIVMNADGANGSTFGDVAFFSYQEAASDTIDFVFRNQTNGQVWFNLKNGNAYIQSDGSFSGKNVTVTGSINGSTTTGLPTNRNGTATSVPIYTGTTTPSSPPTGSIWVKA